ncbi:MAG: transcription/translation regulatory transformer protein RfaH [Gammaproteobacteria bacterium]|nr:MAG: transcription/translation regulatory transformer protein RfaH [Gammaproteobacteria bacterium]
MKSWHLVHTKPRQEVRAEENLVRQGYTVYLPRARVARRRRGRLLRQVEPLFPRYLFIHLEPGVDNWAPLRSTFGVSNVVRFGLEAAMVPDALVNALRAREDGDGLCDLLQAAPAPGDRVLVVEGELAGLDGVFVTGDGDARATILLDIVGRATRVRLPADWVETRRDS